MSRHESNRHASFFGWLTASARDDSPSAYEDTLTATGDSPSAVGDLPPGVRDPRTSSAHAQPPGMPGPGGSPDGAPPIASSPPPSEVPAFDAGWAIFLDIDGTLLDFADHPRAVIVDPALLGLIARLREATGGAVALISGRSIADVQSLFTPLAFAVAGQHGIERKGVDGVVRSAVLAGGAILAAAEELSAISARHEGMLIENKGMTLALHYRRNPRLARCAKHAAHVIARRLGPRFEVQSGKHVVEVKPSGRNKGSAIAEFLAEPPFAGRRPVFIGDDSTDEFGFDTVNRLGGHSIKVGSGRSRARWRLPEAGAVRRWLTEYVHWLESAAQPAAR